MNDRAVELLRRLVDSAYTCDECNGTGKSPGDVDSACLSCGGAGFLLCGECIDIAQDAAKLLKEIGIECQLCKGF